MYSVGEEFEVVIDDMNEYFTCIANLNLKGKEYIIGEDEEGTKRVFLYDSLDDEITVLMDDDEEDILQSGKKNFTAWIKTICSGMKTLKNTTK